MQVTGKTLGQWFMLALFGVVLYLCIRIMQPFLIPIFLALILSTLLDPVYEKLTNKMKNRRSLAALVVCLGLTVAILLPILFLSMSLAREANDAYQSLKDPETVKKIAAWLDPAANPLFRRIEPWLPSSWRFENFDIGTQLGSQAQRIGVAVLAVAGTFASGLFNFLMDYITMLVVLFFLLRDSAYFAEGVRWISPVSTKQENLFVDRFREVTKATVFGTLLTALAQGTLSGLIFLVLGLPNPILWGALTALLSLVPLVGTASVWVPWTIYLIAVGSYGRALAFAVAQVIIVGSIDNFLRPMLIEGRIRMHTLVVFFSILGGIGYFGILGMFFGPLVFAIVVAFLEFYIESPEN
ncbi:MAG TPA: AI-2E family transporter [Terriglobia bacterium]|nr:AI-2E family transporter [Terriglobia bacterium]